MSDVNRFLYRFLEEIGFSVGIDERGVYIRSHDGVGIWSHAVVVNQKIDFTDGPFPGLCPGLVIDLADPTTYAKKITDLKRAFEICDSGTKEVCSFCPGHCTNA